MQLKSIGSICCNQGSYSLLIEEAYRPALLELDQFDTLQVLYWCHHLDQESMRAITVVEKPYRHAPERMGIFATRSPLRPNPIALTAVSILSIDMQNGIIQVPYIDAEDNSPLLDIKPYTPSIDRIRDTRPPAWSAHWPSCVEESGEFDWAAEFVNAK